MQEELNAATKGGAAGTIASEDVEMKEDKRQEESRESSEEQNETVNAKEKAQS